ncbi:hypothetical protein D3C86_1864080 [compost metagenome]
MEQVLHRQWDAVQRTAALAARQLFFGLARLRHGLLGRHMGVAVQCAVEALDARQLGLGDLDRRQLAAADQQRQFVHLQVVQIAGGIHA